MSDFVCNCFTALRSYLSNDLTVVELLDTLQHEIDFARRHFVR